MKTKRLKKLLMGMGLSRNQVNHMVKASARTAQEASAISCTTSTRKEAFKALSRNCFRISEALCWQMWWRATMAEDFDLFTIELQTAIEDADDIN